MKHVLLIPSCGIGPGPNRLSKIDTLLRLELGLALWKKGGYDAILVMGGIFNPPTIQTTPAAELMKNWLVTEGVPEESIFSEVESLDTYENISKGLGVLRNAGYGEALLTVVTQWQHAIRFWLTFRLGYGKSVSLVPMRYPISWHTFFWELLFILHHLVFPKGERSPFAAKNRKRRASGLPLETTHD